MKNCIFSLVFILIGCVYDSSSKLQQIVVDVEKASTNSAFSKFKVVNLELTDESMLKEVDKVAFADNRIFVLSYNESVPFIFNGNGKFISKLKRGNGPGELIFSSDIQVKEDTLFVIDIYRKIKAYSLDGEYYKDVYSVENPAFSFMPCNNGVLLLDPNQSKKTDWMVSYLSDQGNLSGLLKKNSNVKNISFFGAELMKSNCFSWPYSDTIYSVDTKLGRVEPKYHVDFKGLFVDTREYNEKQNAAKVSGVSDNKVSWINDMAISDGDVFFSYSYNKKKYFVRVIDEVPQIYSTFYSGLPEMKAKAVGSQGNRLIYSYEPFQLNEYRENNRIDPELLSIYDTVSDENTSNPILVFVDAF